ncbi:hypothetical protein F4809DRAFT_598868 [Biscogniauxia mediterranea]|nr:hypothetical protein F4809DRAFT_598868 [Biscogniauxia mediterranea]
MEAIAAAGVVPGLASALVQLGTATFHFYQQLRSRQKTIKHSKEDITTATRRLCQHEEFIQGKDLLRNSSSVPTYRYIYIYSRQSSSLISQPFPTVTSPKIFNHFFDSVAPTQKRRLSNSGLC